MIQATARGEVVRYDLATDHHLPLPRYFTTCYRVGDTMVDTGASRPSRALLQALQASPPARILLTHLHEDHIGGVGALREAFGDVPFHGHPGTLEVLADPRGRQPLHPYRRLFWGWPGAAAGGRALADGDVVDSGAYRFVALHTPGHSPDHLCFYEPDRGWVFTGDLYVGGLDKAMRIDADGWAIVASLRRVLDLAPAVVFPGAARIPAQPAEALRTKIDYYQDVGGRILDLHRRGWPDRRIARALFGGITRVELVTGGHFSRLGLVRSFLRSPPA